jgi:hypothetical protein
MYALLVFRWAGFSVPSNKKPSQVGRNLERAEAETSTGSTLLDIVISGEPLWWGSFQGRRNHSPNKSPPLTLTLLC